MIKNQSFFIILVTILCSCAVTKKVAPIEYNHNDYKKNTANKSNTGEIINPFVEYNNTADIYNNDSDRENTANIFNDSDGGPLEQAEKPIELTEKIIYHEVQIGETIEEIAEKYSQSVTDIAKLNDLPLPYYLDEFQIIKIKIKNTANQPPATGTDRRITVATNAEEDAVPTSILPEKIIQKKITKIDYLPPLSGKIISKFGDNTDFGVNKGVSIEAKAGTKVLATAKGKVIYADYDGTYGNLVIIKLEGKNIITSYAHLQDILLTKGANIAQGDVIGYVGSTGKVKKPQLHFGIREGKTAKDPTKYVRF